MDLSEIHRAIKTGLTALEAAPPLRGSEWAAEHFFLSAESSYVEGRWEAYPFQTAILDAMGSDEIEEVDLFKSARVGYTKMLLSTMGYFSQHKRRNQALWQPTDDDSDEFCKTELEPMLRDVAIMQKVFPESSAKNKNNTLRQKTFLGSNLHLRGGKAAKNFRRLSVDVAILDELDGFDTDVEKEGSPFKLAAKRVEGATFPKVIAGSTGKLKGLSMIEARHDQATLRFRFFVPCPHCSEYHVVEWGGKGEAHGFKWQKCEDHDATAASVLHYCPHCAAGYSQAQYLSVWHRGRWIAQTGDWIDEGFVLRTPEGERQPWPKHIAFWIWTAYSPQASWSGIVRDFLSALDKQRKGDSADMKTFTNTTLGRTWEEQVEKTEASELSSRAESYPLRVVPAGGLVLVAGVDVQGNRFEITVWAIGRGEEMWVVDYVVLAANPADQREWDNKLDPYLLSTFPHAHGGQMKLEAVAIDSGGHYTHQCYNFVRSRKSRKIFATKGESKYGRPIKSGSTKVDVSWRGTTIKHGVQLWFVGTDTAKDLLFGRLKVTQPGPGYVHFSSELPDTWFAQLTGEKRVQQKTARGELYVWVKRTAGTRNEALDTTVLALFCVQAIDLHKYTDRMWDRLEAAVAPPMQDMFALPVQTYAPPVAPSPEMAQVPPPAALIKKPPAKQNHIASSAWNSRL